MVANDVVWIAQVKASTKRNTRPKIVDRAIRTIGRIRCHFLTKILRKKMSSEIRTVITVKA